METTICIDKWTIWTAPVQPSTIVGQMLVACWRQLCSTWMASLQVQYHYLVHEWFGRFIRTDIIREGLCTNLPSSNLSKFGTEEKMKMFLLWEIKTKRCKNQSRHLHSKRWQNWKMRKLFPARARCGDTVSCGGLFTVQKKQMQRKSQKNRRYLQHTQKERERK